jgi:hypothetical protein
MSILVIAPYLPLAEPVEVGDWRLISFRRLFEADVVPARLRHPVERFIEAFQEGSNLGAVAYQDDDGLGAEFEMSDFRRLGYALRAGVLVANPSFLGAGGAAEWTVATSENATLVGQPLDDANGYASTVGVLVRTLKIQGALDGEPLPKIRGPAELPTPMAGTFDEELAHATYGLLKEGGTPARRLRRALDWYGVVLSNAEAVTVDVRVGGARSALEVLLDSGDSTKRLVRAFGGMVDEPDAARRKYKGRPEVFWSKGQVELTSSEWWLTRLCDLRNAITHGNDIPDDLWQHEGHHQLDHLHDNLQLVLRSYLAEEIGDEHLRLAKSKRRFARSWQRYSEAVEKNESGSADV